MPDHPESSSGAFPLVRRAFRAVSSPFVADRAITRTETERHGTFYGGWRLPVRGLHESSIVYSAGVGKDVSFDLSLIGKHGCMVHAFDPTPRSVAWVESQRLPSRFVFHPIGLANRDGQARFDSPIAASFVSFSMSAHGERSPASVECPVMRVGSIMRMLGHDRIDVLKLDIEGAEYDVLADVLSADLDIGQILVEFHHRFSAGGLQRTRDTTAALKRSGYRLVWVSLKGIEYSFLRDPAHGQ